MIEALGKNIIIEPLKVDKKDVILRIEHTPEYYKVLSIGDKVENIAVGDVIFVMRFEIREFTFDGEKMMACSADAVYAKKGKETP